MRCSLNKVKARDIRPRHCEVAPHHLFVDVIGYQAKPAVFYSLETNAVHTVRCA